MSSNKQYKIGQRKTYYRTKMRCVLNYRPYLEICYRKQILRWGLKNANHKELFCNE